MRQKKRRRGRIKKMMELIYVWIERYKNIKQCAYPLNRKFKIDVTEYDPKNLNEQPNVPVKEIKIERMKEDEDEDFIFEYTTEEENSFKTKATGNIKNINILVGENGAGKSNFLSCIANPDSWDEESSFICIYINEEKEYVFEFWNIGIRYKDIRSQCVSGYGTAIYTCRKGKENKSWEFRPEHLRWGITDVEYMYIKESLSMNPTNVEDKQSRICRTGSDYTRSGFKYQLEYLLKRTEQQLNNNQNKIKLSVDHKSRDSYAVKILPEMYPGQKVYFDFYQYDKGVYKKAFPLRLLEEYLHTLINGNEQRLESQIQDFNQYISQYNGDVERLSKGYVRLVEKVEEINQRLIEKGINAYPIQHKNLPQSYKQFINALHELIQNLSPECFRNSFECAIDIGKIKADKELQKIVEIFLEGIEVEEIYHGFINMHFLNIEFDNLSDGEKYYMRVYSTMKMAFEHNKMTRFSNIVLVLDEPDMHFHPEWSRRFISDLIKFLNKTYTDIVFQVIITTHSPFILSDVPNDHVLKISRQNKGTQIGYSKVEACEEKTFGTNIHTLLRDSFFMEATIGEWARKRINRTIEFLTSEENSDKEIERAKKVIEMIGEPIIKNKLKVMYDKRFPNDTWTYISHYENKIKELKNIINEGIMLNKPEIKSLEEQLESTLKMVKKLSSEQENKSE